MVKREQLIIAVIASAIIGFFIGRLTGPGGSVPGFTEQGPASFVDSGRIPIAGAPARGAAYPKVVIVEISDFQCPFCAKAARTVEELAKDYPDTARIVFRNNPLSFHKDAFLAAEAALAANEQGKFWEMHDLLFANQQALKQADLETYAAKLGLDMARFKADLEGHRFKPQVEADQKLAAELGAQGTPAFFINGTLISGAQPIDKFKEAVKKELSAVAELTKAGTPLSQVYAKRVEANFKAPARAPAQEDDTAVYKVPVGSSPVLGSNDALVTLVVFSEFECPFCSRVKPTLEQVRQVYGDKVRIVFKHNPLPFHKNAFLASEAAAAAGAQGKFWEMHDLLFANQKALGRSELEGYARKLGLDVARFAADLDGHVYKEAIEADMGLARQIGATGTPNTFVNGRKLTGAKGFGDFKKVIDEELLKAQALVDKGTAASQVYERLTASGLSRPPKPLAQDRKKQRQKDDPKAVYKVPLPAGDTYAKGPDNALVTIMEFSEFQCPYCKRASETMKELLAAYPKDVRLIFRHNPLGFHKNALPAAMAALAAAEQGKFWPMHDLLFANQKSLDAASLEGYARQVGLDMERYRSFIQANRGHDRIVADQQLAQQLGARGTPAFYINGRKIAGAQPLDVFKAVVEEELAKARDLVGKGTSPAQIYEALIRDGATRPVYLDAEDAAGEAGTAGWQDVRVGDAPTRGERKSKAELVIFSDFQCPYCAKAAKAIDELTEEQKGRVRIAFKHFPLAMHKDAFAASEAAMAAHEQGKFWEMHDVLFANQKALSPQDLERYARQIGLNMAKFQEALSTHRFKAQIEADMQQGRQLGVSGTPTIFINGKLHQGSASAEALKQAIDQELAARKTQRMLGPGLRPQDPRLPRKLDIKRLDFNPLKQRQPAEQPPAGAGQ